MSVLQSIRAFGLRIRGLSLEDKRKEFQVLAARDPEDLRAKHWLAAIEWKEGDQGSARSLLVSALGKDNCHPDGPIEVYEFLCEAEGEAVAAEYLSWFMKARDAVIFEQINTYNDWLKTSRYVDSPLIVQIETLTLCNAACTFCQYPELTRKGDRMPDSTIDKIINEMAALPHDLPLNVTLYGVSEPFLDKRVFDHIEAINSKVPQALIGINTNGAPLTEANLKRLAKLKLAWMGVSVNDYRKAEYQKTMKIPFDRTLKVLDMLHTKRQSGEIPFAIGITRAGDGSIHDLKFIAWVRKTYPAFTSNFSPHFVWVGDDGATTAPKIGCSHWFELAIRGNGLVSFCCIDGHVKYPRGDVNTQSLLEIYNAPEFRRLRNVGVSRHDIEQCQNCTSG